MGLASSIARKALIKSAKKAQRPARSGAVEGLKRIAVDAEPAALRRGSKTSKYAQETKAKTTKGDTRSNYQQRMADKKADNTKASTRGAASKGQNFVMGEGKAQGQVRNSRGKSTSRELATLPRRDVTTVSEKGGKSGVSARRTAGAAALAAAAAMASKGGEKKTEESSAKKKEDPKATPAAKKATPAAKKAATSSTAATSSKKTEAVVKKDEPKKTKPSGGVSSFGKAFREARNAGLMEFTHNGKRYTTRLAEESNTDHKKSISKIKDKNDAAYEKKIKELSKKK